MGRTRLQVSTRLITHIVLIAQQNTCHSIVRIPILRPCDGLWQSFPLLLFPSCYNSDCDCAKLSSPAKISMGINGNSAGCQPNRLIGLGPKMFEFHYPRQHFYRQPANVTWLRIWLKKNNSIVNSYCIWTCSYSLGFRKMQRLKKNTSML